MVYEYAMGYHNFQWTMTQHKSGVILVLGDLQKEVDGRRKKRRRRRPLALLIVCRLIHQETLPILFDKIRFDIAFDKYLYHDRGLLESRLRFKTISN